MPKFIVHTDNPDAFDGAFADYDNEVRRTTSAQKPYWEVLVDCHKDVLDCATPGDRVSLLTADIVVSREFFSVCDARLVAGIAMVVAFGPRTTGGFPPIGASASELSEFALANQHPLVDRLTWPDGATNCPTVIFFRDGNNAVLHAFHLHPIVIVARSSFHFAHTIDCDLVTNFKSSEVSIVQNCAELSIVECSPSEWDPCEGQPLQPLTEDYLVEFASHAFQPLHKEFFRHRIVQRGSAGAISYDVPDAVLRMLGVDACVRKCL